MAKRRTTVKERKLVEGIAAGKTMREAAVHAQLSPNGTPETARVEAYRTLQRPHVIKALEDALDRAGATLERSARVISEAHDAKGLAGADHPVRLKAAELNFKARRILGANQEGDGGGSGTINLFAVLGIVEQSRKERGLPI